MLKAAAIEHFGTLTAVAEALGITVAAVSLWDDVIPEGSAYKLQVITGGALVVKPYMYKDRPKRGQTLHDITT
jgi:transcriptional repressor of cell division inhibition gene dicB